MTTQTSDAYNKFIDFINGQDDYKEIDHFSWSTCAVGEFVDEILFKEGLASDRGLLMDDFREILVRNDIALYNILNENGEDDNNDVTVETYGDLKMWIKEYGKD